MKTCAGCGRSFVDDPGVVTPNEAIGVLKAKVSIIRPDGSQSGRDFYVHLCEGCCGIAQGRMDILVHLLLRRGG